MDKYFKFDINQFIKDYPENKMILNTLERERQTALPSEYEELDYKIDKYKRYVRNYMQAFGTLSEEEQMIIDTFFFRKNINRIEFLKGYLHLEKTEVYKRKCMVVDKMANFILRINK